MQLNKGLNLDTLPENAQSGDFRFANNMTLDNTYRFPINEVGMEFIDIEINNIRGIISFDCGFAIFAQESLPTIYVIKTNYETSPKERIYRKLILTSDIYFDIEHPIRGTYIYTQNEHLNIIFSSGVDGNFEDKQIDIDKYGTSIEYSLTSDDMYTLDINPNLQFPSITSTITSGTLLTGSYQIAICYKIDKDYSNYSLLSLPKYIYGTDNNGDGKNDGSAPNSNSNFGISYTLTNLDIHYKYYKIAIIYNNGTTYIVKTTDDISTNKSTFNLTNIDTYSTSSLDNTLINSIYYSNSESLQIMNNRLYRANLKNNNLKTKNNNGDIIYFDDVAQQIASTVNLELKTSIIDNTEIYSKSSQFIKFQNDEVYALYLTFGDKKGNVIGSYPINSPNIIGSGLLNNTQYSTENITKEEIIIPNPYTITLNKIKNSILNKTLSYTDDQIPLSQSFSHEECPSNDIIFTIDFYSGMITLTGNSNNLPGDLDIYYQFSWFDTNNEEIISKGQCKYRAGNNNIQTTDINNFDSVSYIPNTGTLEVVNNTIINASSGTHFEDGYTYTIKAYTVIYTVSTITPVSQNYTFNSTIEYNTDNNNYLFTDLYLNIPQGQTSTNFGFVTLFKSTDYFGNVSYVKNYQLDIDFANTLPPNITFPFFSFYSNGNTVNIENPIITRYSDTKIRYTFYTNVLITSYDHNPFQNIDYCVYTLTTN